MRLRREMIDYLADRIVKGLAEKEHVETDDDDAVASNVAEIIVEDLSVEDDLNVEVKAMLEKMEDEIDRSNINYRKMFQMVKQKLARERGLIL
ncbi:MAG: DUF507 family protein [Candidatus Nitrospinota bacterium M3_3B_026]